MSEDGSFGHEQGMKKCMNLGQEGYTFISTDRRPATLSVVLDGVVKHKTSS